MPIFPEIAYQFRVAKDTASPTLEQVLFATLDVSAAATTVDTSATPYTCPGDRVAIITQVLLKGQPGAAQWCTRLRLILTRGPEAYPIDGREGYTALAAPGYVYHSNKNPIYLHPGWGLYVNGTFNAGAAANFVQLALQGFLIPRGNIS